MKDEDAVEFDADASDEEGVAAVPPSAIVHATDWTTETIVTQFRRGNIWLNPSFQRRDAWKKSRKSRFMESLIVGLPIPQIVLAESREGKGKFIVLDGKQRLLSICQFWGLVDGTNNEFALSGLTLRKGLNGVTYRKLATDSTLEDDHNALCNQTIRTVVVRNWQDDEFLHTVFLRLNTGSVTLSSQELRQALKPGPFGPSDETGSVCRWSHHPTPWGSRFSRRTVVH